MPALIATVYHLAVDEIVQLQKSRETFDETSPYGANSAFSLGCLVAFKFQPYAPSISLSLLSSP